MAIKEEIMALEKRLWESRDPKPYEEVLDEPAIIVMEPAGFLDKATAMKYAEEGGGFKDVQFSDVRIAELSPECVVVAYHGEATSPEGKPQRSSVASTYVKKDGNWKLGQTTHQPWGSEKSEQGAD